MAKSARHKTRIVYRILVVDADPHSRQFLADALNADARYKVETAVSAHEVIERVEAASPPYDLVITEAVMPGMSGLEMARRIKAARANLRVMIATAYETDRTVIAALSKGADDYLTKPIDLGRLRAAVARVLDPVRMAKRTGPEMPADAGTEATASLPKSGFSVSGAPGQWVEVVGQGNYELVERFRRFALQLAGSSLTESDREDLQVALEEMGQNAIEWGNREDPTKRVKLSYCLAEDRVAFRIEDEGAGFNVSQLPDPSRDPAAHLEARKELGKRPGGFGVYLARKVVDEVLYNRRGNVVTLVKYLRPRKPGGPAARPEVRESREDLHA